jgi:dGTPase
MGFLKRDELPGDAANKLGTTNDEIVSTLITNVIYNSFDKDYVAFDTETSDALYELKRFNYEKIYNHPLIKKEKFTIKRGMKILFDKYMTDIEEKNADSKSFNHFLNHKSEQYIEITNDAEKVRDFIATMTDRYFNQELEDYVLPGRAID